MNNTFFLSALTVGFSLSSLQAQEVWDPVSWRQLEKVNELNGVVSKNAEALNRWDGGAYSVKILEGDGGFRCKPTTNTGYFMVGLARANFNASYRHLDYAIYGRNDGSLVIFEKGKSKGIKGSYLAQDELKVTREEGVIKYYKNNELLYTSLVLNNDPLFADFSIKTLATGVASSESMGFTNGDSDQDGLPDSWEQHLIATSDLYTSLADITATSDEDEDYHPAIIEYLKGSNPLVADREKASPIVWKQNRNTEVVEQADFRLGSSLRKLDVSGGWNADAIATSFLPANGGVVFGLLEASAKLMVGLNKVNTSAHYRDLDFAIYCNNGVFSVYESGKRIKFGGYSSRYDTFSIERLDGQILYLRNGEIFYTSEVVTNAPLLIDLSILSKQTGVVNAGVWQASGGAGDVDLDGIADTAEVEIINHSESDEVSTLAGVDTTTDFDNDGYLDSSEIIAGSNPTFSVLDSTQLVPVIWRNLQKVEVIEDKLQKLESDRHAWDGGALSQKLYVADGVLQFSVEQISDARGMIGLNNADVNTDYRELDFAFFIKPNGGFQIRESGVARKNFASYTNADRFAIKRTAGQISYYHNDNLLYVSETINNEPLFIDTSIHSNIVFSDAQAIGLIDGDLDQDRLPDSWEQALVDADPEDLLNDIAEITADGDIDGDYLTNIVELSKGTDTPDPSIPAWKAIVWKDFVGTQSPAEAKYATGSDLIKIAERRGWNADARSTASIVADGGVTARVGKHGDQVMLGLNLVNDSSHYRELDYALYVNQFGSLTVYEKGVRIGYFGIASQDDKLSIERVDGIVSYSKNDGVIYASLVENTSPLFVDVSLLKLNDSFVNCATWGTGVEGDSDGDGLADDWEQAIVDADPNDNITSILQISPTSDSDGDGMPDGQEYALGIDALNPDSDQDGMLDGYEVQEGRSFNPNFPDNPEVKLLVLPTN